MSLPRISMAAALLTLARLSLASSPLDNLLVMPCHEGGCDNCTVPVFPMFPNYGWPHAATFDKFEVDGFHSSSSAGGYGVWWHIDEPDPGCKAMIRQPSTMGDGVLESQAGGNIWVLAEHEGCYFMQMSGGPWSLNYCCGDGDCMRAGAGHVYEGLTIDGGTAKTPEDAAVDGIAAPSSALGQSSSRPQLSSASFSSGNIVSAPTPAPDGNGQNAKAAAPPSSPTAQPASALESKTVGSEPTSSNQPQKTTRADSRARQPSPLHRRSGGLWCDDLADYVDCVDNAWHPDYTCSIISKSNTYWKTGNQTTVMDTLTCDSKQDSCTQTKGKTYTYSATVTNERSFTHTTTDGYTVTVGVGVDFLGLSATASKTWEHSYSESVEHSSSLSQSDGISDLFSQSYPQPAGTAGYVWLTPKLECNKLTLGCPGGNVDIEACRPLKNEGEVGFTCVGAA